MLYVDKLFLGESDKDILVDLSEENYIATLRMVQQANRTIDIISRTLDPVIYNTQEFVAAVKQVVLNSKNSRVRVLVNEPNSIVKQGHRLVDLALTLTTYMEIRVPSKEHELVNEAIIIVDETGYIYRKSSDRYEGKLNFNDKRASRLLTHEFEQIWGKSRSDPNFRRALV